MAKTEIYCITLWQPWASWIAMGWKTTETRTHARLATLENRLIGIHAGLKWDDQAIGVASKWLSLEQQHMSEELRSIRGGIVATAYVSSHRRVHAVDSDTALIECSHRTRFGLFLEDIKPLIHPIPYKGSQGIWKAEITLP